ncbi:hypothetical protein H072_11209 [Dactylellina haptotyla CBS 200.50]|uniref:Uncharacterized protein n=1 Tax=Dactylellina haptotyla (strain CBS 200.50) TaxID=1284197 RepID=S8B8M8_DACHA|nr:hypothetical protein H072_11209 [Dactylellina haptotyla CBS 200.50]
MSIKKQHLAPYAAVDPTNFKDLLGKSVLITGGGYGIGASIAKSFAAGGAAEIILVGRNEAKLKATSEELKIFKNTKVTFYKVDITSKNDVKHLFDSLKEPVQYLINNAGFMPAPANFVDVDLEDYWEAFTVNVFGTVLVTQAFLRHRQAFKPDTPAVVVTLNTIGAYSFRIGNHSGYGASKAALARWSESIAVDVPQTVARFISVHPGFVHTAMGAKSGLEGAFPATDIKLAADFVAWTTTEQAAFLSGRFAWVNWDVDELVAKKDEIVQKDLFRTAISDST